MFRWFIGVREHLLGSKVSRLLILPIAIIVFMAVDSICAIYTSFDRLDLSWDTTVVLLFFAAGISLFTTMAVALATRPR